MSRYVLKRAVKLFKKGSSEKNTFAAVAERLTLLFLCLAAYRAFLPRFSDFEQAFCAALFWVFCGAISMGIWHLSFDGEYRINKKIWIIFPAFFCAIIFRLCGDLSVDLAFVAAVCTLFIYAISTMFRGRSEIAFFTAAFALAACAAAAYAFREFEATKMNFIEQGKSFMEYKISPHIGALAFGSSEAMACFLCALIPYPLSAVLSRRFEQVMKIFSVAVFVIMAYGVFMSFSLLPIMLMCVICMLSVFMFSPGGVLRKRYFCYFSALCMAFICAYFLNLSYVCAYENVFASDYLNAAICKFSETFFASVSEVGLFPNADFNASLPEFSGGSFAYFAGRYGLIFLFSMLLPSLYLIYAGFNALWKIPVERWIGGRARMPLEKRKNFGKSKRREREKMKYESSLTPFDRIFCGAATLSFASFCIMCLFFDAISSWCGLLAFSVSAGIILRFSSPKFSLGGAKKKALCFLAASLSFLFSAMIAWKISLF